MNERLDWNLVAKYLFGECTEDETALVQAWLEANPARERLLSELRAHVSTTKQPRPKRDVDALWQRLEQHVEGRTPGGAPGDQRADRLPRPTRSAEPARPVRPDRSSRRRRRPSALRQAVRAAASVLAVLCVVGLALWWVDDGQPGVAEREVKVFATERGQRATIRLTDGTLVRLNAASSLTVSPSFGAEQRTVRLEGEAYFDVARDTTRPFIVQTARATTRVLGTAFNLSAYPEDVEVRLLVAEGSVAFETATAASDEASSEAGEANATEGENTKMRRPSQGVVLTAHEMATLVASGRVVRGRSDSERSLAWMEGDLYFEDASFAEVVRAIERWYDVRVVRAGRLVPSGHLNARFSERESLREVLDVIAAAFELRYEWTEKTVRFTASRSGSSS